MTVKTYVTHVYHVLGKTWGSPAKCFTSSVFLVQTLNKNPPKCLRLWVDHLRSVKLFSKVTAGLPMFAYLIGTLKISEYHGKKILMQIIIWNVETQVVTSWKYAREWKPLIGAGSSLSLHADVQAAHNTLKWAVAKTMGRVLLGIATICDLGRMAPEQTPNEGNAKIKKKNLSPFNQSCKKVVCLQIITFHWGLKWFF